MVTASLVTFPLSGAHRGVEGGGVVLLSHNGLCSFPLWLPKITS